jgi:hypothetical protein
MEIMNCRDMDSLKWHWGYDKPRCHCISYNRIHFPRQFSFRLYTKSPKKSREGKEETTICNMESRADTSPCTEGEMITFVEVCLDRRFLRRQVVSKMSAWIVFPWITDSVLIIVEGPHLSYN